MKKCILFLFILFAGLSYYESFAQALVLPTPKGWNKEAMIFPIDFAPGIPYKGMEELRFSPGWSQAESEEYWSYTFLWLIGDKSTVTTPLLNTYLKEYYTGLINSNVDKTKRDSLTITDVEVKIESLKKSSYSFGGTVQMFDYMAQKPITLNVKIRKKICPENRRMALLFEISPQPEDHFIWRNFEGIWNGFNCN